MSARILPLVLCLLTTVVGCSTLQQQPDNRARVEIAANKFVELPQPSELNQNVAISQLITVEWNDTTHQLPVQLEVTDTSVKLAGFSSWGTRILSLEYQDNHIDTQILSGLGTVLPDPKQVLFYLMITLWPESVWQPKLKQIDWRLTETSQLRTLIDEKGREVVIIQYSNQQKLAGDIYMTNTISNYKIRIQTLSNSTLPL